MKKFIEDGTSIIHMDQLVIALRPLHYLTVSNQSRNLTIAELLELILGEIVQITSSLGVNLNISVSKYASLIFRDVAGVHIKPVSTSLLHSYENVALVNALEMLPSSAVKETQACCSGFKTNL